MSFQFQPASLDSVLDEIPAGSTQIDFNDAIWVPIVCAMHAPGETSGKVGYDPRCQFCRQEAARTLAHILAVHGGP